MKHKIWNLRYKTSCIIWNALKNWGKKKWSMNDFANF